MYKERKSQLQTGQWLGYKNIRWANELEKNQQLFLNALKCVYNKTQIEHIKEEETRQENSF